MSALFTAKYFSINPKTRCINYLKAKVNVYKKKNYYFVSVLIFRNFKATILIN